MDWNQILGRLRCYGRRIFHHVRRLVLHWMESIFSRYNNKYIRSYKFGKMEFRSLWSTAIGQAFINHLSPMRFRRLIPPGSGDAPVCWVKKLFGFPGPIVASAAFGVTLTTRIRHRWRFARRSSLKMRNRRAPPLALRHLDCRFRFARN
jgi:hypothetical protein